MNYLCCNEQRKSAVLANSTTLNGIDFLEVLDHEAIPIPSPRQQTLLLHCLRAVSAITANNVLIEGGESIVDIKADWLAPASGPFPAQATSAEQQYFQALPDADKVLVIRTDKVGDFSPYTLRLVTDAGAAPDAPVGVTQVLDGFDLQLASVRFSFKVECGPDFDCAPRAATCPPETPSPPPINYLAKDYGSFRTVILDRLSQLLPNWNGASEADLGVMLAELIAYRADRLSYQQDAVATEAYLGAARSRISLRRHALLVDYRVHDGCNARAWVHVTAAGEPGNAAFMDRTATRFYTFAPGMPANLTVGSNNEERALFSGVQVFEPMCDAYLYPDHNQMSFYTWGDTNCCLPSGATTATLAGSYDKLSPGDVLIFQEMKGPATGNPADADIRHRWAVRLTHVATQDAGGRPLEDPLYRDAAGDPIRLTEIVWHEDDALPLPFCVSSSFVDASGDTQAVTDVSVVVGNVVLADHGLSFPPADLGVVTAARPFLSPRPAADRCHPQRPTTVPARFRPQVPLTPLTQAVPLLDTDTGLHPPAALPTPFLLNVTAADRSATGLMSFAPSSAIPVIGLEGTRNAQTDSWSPLLDLLESNESDRVFVVEVESDQTAVLRFGDNINGKQPEFGTSFRARFRIGNGAAGNVGADSINHIAASDARLQACRNPLPAVGGADPETNEQIRRRAPRAFLRQERAVRMADYEAVVLENPQVQNAVARLRWTGSWYTVFTTVDPGRGGSLRPALQQTLVDSLERYRLAGQDLEVRSPIYVSLEIVLEICVQPEYFRSDVQQSLVQVLGNGILPNGQNALFHADNLTFGQTVYLSSVYRAARSVPGVLSVRATKFQPQGRDTMQYLTTGEIKLGTLQVARLDNDPSYPDHGQISLTLLGGK
jgi:hypothetical protein